MSQVVAVGSQCYRPKSNHPKIRKKTNLGLRLLSKCTKGNHQRAPQHHERVALWSKTGWQSMQPMHCLILFDGVTCRDLHTYASGLPPTAQHTAFVSLVGFRHVVVGTRIIRIMRGNVPVRAFKFSFGSLNF